MLDKLIGRKEVKIDNQGRIIIPLKWKEVFQNSKEVFGITNFGAYLIGNSLLDGLEKVLKAESKEKAEKEALNLRVIWIYSSLDLSKLENPLSYSEMEQMHVDDKRRITIKPNLFDYAKLEKEGEAIILGDPNKILVMNPETYDSYIELLNI